MCSVYQSQFQISSQTLKSLECDLPEKNDFTTSLHQVNKEFKTTLSLQFPDKIKLNRKEFFPMSWQHRIYVQHLNRHGPYKNMLNFSLHFPLHLFFHLLSRMCVMCMRELWSKDWLKLEKKCWEWGVDTICRYFNGIFVHIDKIANILMGSQDCSRLHFNDTWRFKIVKHIEAGSIFWDKNDLGRGAVKVKSSLFYRR